MKPMYIRIKKNLNNDTDEKNKKEIELKMCKVLSERNPGCQEYSGWQAKNEICFRKNKICQQGPAMLKYERQINQRIQTSQKN